MKWQQDWEELVCSLQRGRANEESSLREKKGYTIFRVVSTTFHALSTDPRNTARPIFASASRMIPLFFLISFDHYFIIISRDQRCVRTRESARPIRYLTWSFALFSDRRSTTIAITLPRSDPLDHGTPLEREEKNLGEKKKITEKSPMFRAHCAPHLLLLYPPSLCTMILPLAPPPPSPLPLPCSFLFYIPLVEERVSQGLHPSNAEIRSPPRNDRWRGDTSEWQESRRSTRAGCREYRIENPPIHQAPGKLFLCTAFSRTPSTTLYRYPVINQQQDSKHQRSFVDRLRMTRIDHDTAKIRTREGNARGFFALDHPEEPTEVPLILYAVLSLVLCIRR